MSSVFDLFSGLSRSARALLPFFEQQVRTDKTAQDIIDQLKAEGRGIRRQTALDIIGALRDNIKTSQRQARLSPDALLNPDLFGVAGSMTKRDYSHHAVVRMHNTITGEVLNQDITVSTDALLSKNQIIDSAAALSQSGRYGSNLVVDSTEYVESFKSPLLGE